MANCFGDVVDNYKLDEMERYVGKAKSQEAYCAVGGVDSFQGDWEKLYDKVNNAAYTCNADSDGFKIDASTATGNSPVFTATIQIHFSQ